MIQKKELNVGFIGCGKIAPFHADVLKFFNVNISAVSYKTNQENAELFANKYDVKNIYPDWQLLIKEKEVDFLWLVPTWDQIDLIFEEIISSGIPAFFEKPVSLSSDKIKRVLSNYSKEKLSYYQIGYNRRFYEVVNILKESISKEKIVAVSVDLPEPVKGLGEQLLKNRLIQNAAHLYDTLLYLLGSENVEIKNLKKINYNHLKDNHFLHLEINQVPINITSIWNSPQNYTIKIYTESEKLFVLSPFEELNVYQGFDVKEPTEEMPIRKYLPKKIENYYELAEKFKPGFELQAKCFLENTLWGKTNNNSHKLNDSIVLLELLEAIKK